MAAAEDGTLISPEKADSSYWWERMFGAACTCVTDESALTGEEVDGSQIKVVEEGKLVATVTDAGQYVEDDEKKDDDAVPPPVVAVGAGPSSSQTKNTTTEKTTTTKAGSSSTSTTPQAAAASLTSAGATTNGKTPPQGGSAAMEERKEAAPKREKAPPPAIVEKPVPKIEMQVDLKEVKAKLKGDGIPFKKHCRDGKIRPRTLVLSDDESMVGWKKNDPKKKMVPLALINEVRPASAVDKSTVTKARPKGMGGTETLRKSAEGPAVSRLAFSLILDDRTIDIQVASEVEAKKLCAAFKVLVDHARAK
eukprot:CAMPEP_0118896710 /NCGR_PEP_ID=MMETSP1166-20130328/4444_1 /TAXON_ID=1104430 /ORGANISM="Chrysoreinhardia sp, Strain CCMP3193" /LENGTH=307 /DNA_ID=CAMNT_0006835769 /DNA_START=95 /DNA_END=1018 /DNA_ORIENTATION=+